MAVRTPKAEIDGALVRWAREASLISREVLAKGVGVPGAKVDDWEQNRDHPSIAQLRKIASITDRPLGVFFLPSPPDEPAPLQAFRKGREAGDMSPELASELRRAWERRETALELAAEEPIDVPNDVLDVPVNPGVDPEGTADRIRSALRVSLVQQREVSEDGAFAMWRRALEDGGVLVFETRDIAVGQVRGFSFGDRPLPVIVVNGKDASNGRIFTLMHELVHVLHADRVVCSFDRQNHLERFCDHVAGAILLPENALAADPLIAHATRSTEWTDAALAKNARRYRVSEEAFLIRLVQTGRAPKAAYESRRALYRSRVLVTRKSKSGPPPHVLALKYGGRLYARIVLGAVARGDLTYTEAASHLSLRTKQIERLETALFPKTG